MKWWLRQESNQRHTELQSVALPTELQSLMAVQTGIEPAISSVTGRRIKPLYHWTTNNNCILYLSWQGIEPFFKYTYLQSRHMVAEVGLEPTTFGLWARRATNCSTPRRQNALLFYTIQLFLSTVFSLFLKNIYFFVWTFLKLVFFGAYRRKRSYRKHKEFAFACGAQA